MNVKQFFQRIGNYIKSAWEKGKIQQSFRVTYDVVWNMILFFIIVGAIIAVFAVGVGAGYFASLVKDEPIRDYEDMKNDIYNYEETSKMYFASNKYIGDVNSDIHREEIKLDDVSDVLIDAVVATEDQMFYEHNGVVPKAVVRAVFQEATNSQTKTGGSTLTQQLIKNQILTNEVSFERKAKEMLLAMRLENFFEKDEIMEAYLNIIPYGREASGGNIAGIKTAAKGVFGEDAKDLNLPQSAFLAGLPQNPYAYTPFTNKGEIKDDEALEPGLKRMKVVLKRMYHAGYINEEEYEDAVEYDITADFTEKRVSPTEKYPAVVAEVEKRAKKIILEQLAEEDDISMKEINKDDDLKEKYEELADRALRTKGYKIHSTIDKKMYEAMQKVGKEYENYGPEGTYQEDGEQKTEPVEAGAVLIENNSGKVLSFYPGRNYEIGNNVYNFATQANRPGGSTFKPLTAFAPAMDMGEIQPGSVIADIPYWERPRNVTKQYYGLVSAREALVHSYNVTTTKIFEDIVDENPVEKYTEKMGITFPDGGKQNKSVPLGAEDVTVEKNTNAFATFSNDGKYIPSYMIEKITDSEGNTIYEHESEETEVFSPQTAYLTYDILRDALHEGTGSSIPGQLRNNSVDWAGKTGTSQDIKDSWFIGTNPNVTLGTWLGYQHQDSLECPGCSLSYSQRTQFLWANFVNALSEIDSDLITPQNNLDQPDGIVSRSYCATSGMAPSELCEKAGLVKSDIYNSKYTPNETDDSLTGGSENLVKVDGETVVADKNTPSEFVTDEKGGIALDKDFIEKKGYDKVLSDLSDLIPRRNPEPWKKISIKGSSSKGGIDGDKDKKPSVPGSISANESEMSWQGAEGDLIVGYRIYYAKDKSESAQRIGHTTSNSYALPSKEGVYYVKSVNYFGQESTPSKSVTVKSKKDKDDKDKKDKDKSDKKDKDKKEDKKSDKKEKKKDKKKDKKEDKKDDKKDKDKSNKKDKDKKEDKKDEDD